MYGLGSIFQDEEKNYMVAEALEKYALYDAEVTYEDPGKQAPMGLMAFSGKNQG